MHRSYIVQGGMQMYCIIYMSTGEWSTELITVVLVERWYVHSRKFALNCQCLASSCSARILFSFGSCPTSILKPNF
jgi:hypothetical protein